MAITNPSSSGLVLEFPYTFEVDEADEYSAGLSLYKYKWIITEDSDVTTFIKATTLTDNNEAIFTIGVLKLGSPYYIHCQYLYVDLDVDPSTPVLTINAGQRSFVASYRSPDKPSVTNPSANEEMGTRRPTFNFSSFSGGGTSHAATYVEVYYENDADPDSGNYIYSKLLGAVTSHTVTSDLPTNRLLSVRVKYRNAYKWSDWSNLIDFTTIISVPTTPIIISPYGTNINPRTDIQGSDYNGYGSLEQSHWRLSTNGDGITPESGLGDPYNAYYSTNTTLPNLSIGVLDTWETYWVAVRYENDKGFSVWSPVVEFKTWPAIPSTPTLQSKSEEAITHKLTMILNSYTGEGTHLKTDYIVSTSGDVADEGSYVIWPTELTINLLQWDITGLSGDTQYYIFSRFENEKGWSNYLSTPHYTISNIPNTPLNTYPENNDRDIDFTGFYLEASPFDGDKILTDVVWQISTSSSDWSSPVYEDINYSLDAGYVISENITTLNADARYYWRVKYENEIGWSDWSSPTAFYTYAYHTPDTPSITDPLPDETGVSVTHIIVGSIYNSGGAEPHLSSDWEIILESAGVVVFNSYDDTTNKESITTSALPSGEWLQVRTRYTNVGGDSSWSPYIRFETAPAVPNTPTNQNPINNEIDTVASPILVSSPFVGNFTHLSSSWQVSDDGTFAGGDVVYSSIHNVSNKTSITVGITLNNNTDYWWRVNYTNSVGDSTWSSSTKFTTLINVPNTPVLSTPTDTVTGESQNPTLTSSSFVGDGSHLTSTWEISLDSNFESIAWSKTSNTDLVSVIVDTDGVFNDILLNDSDKLNSNTEYHWRVTYTNRAGNSTPATAFTFTTVIVVPKQPTNLTPIDGQRVVSLLADLTSSIYDSDLTHLTSTWELEDEDGNKIWEAINDAVNLESINLNDGTFVGSYSALTELINDTWYYFKVKYSNSVGFGVFSELTSFNSIALIPITPTIDNPETDNISVTAYEIIGSDYHDPGTGYAEHKSSNWQLSTDSGFAAADIVTESINDETNLTTWTLPTLDKLTYYYVRVRYTNETGTSSYSLTYTFRTIVEVANQPSNILPIDGATGEDWEAIIGLQSSSYSSYEVPLVKPQTASDWEVATDINFTTVVWSSIDDTVNLDTISIPASTLLTNITHYWRVRHKNIGGVSAWSDYTNFTTLPAYPEKPFVTSPIEESENFPRENGSFTGSIYIGEGTHTGSDWEIYDTSDNLAWNIKSAEIPNYLEEIAVNNSVGEFVGPLSGKSQLDYFTEYKFKVRYQNTKGFSSYSDYVNAFSTYNPPNIPIGISPEDSSLNEVIHPNLVGSDYSGNGTHLNSIWQIAKDSLFIDVVWEGTSVGDTDTLTSIIVNDVNGLFKGTLVGKDSLEFDVTYYWKLAYKNEIDYSSYSSILTFTTKKYEQSIILTADIEKKLEYLVNRFVNKDVENRHPNFKLFIEHWLRFMDKYNNQFIFNMTKFNNIKEFYEIVEVFDWANNIKEAHFENFMSADSLEVLQNIYFGTEINPEILRFFRSLNTKKGSPISFQILLRLLGYQTILSTTAPFQYTVKSIDGKIRSISDVQKFNDVINLFHPAGMKYTTTSELLFGILNMNPNTFMNNELAAKNVLELSFILQTVRDAEITQTLVDVFMTRPPTYTEIEDRRYSGRYGWQPFDIPSVTIDDFTNYANETWRIQRPPYIVNV